MQLRLLLPYLPDLERLAGGRVDKLELIARACGTKRVLEKGKGVRGVGAGGGDGVDVDGLDRKETK